MRSMILVSGDLGLVQGPDSPNYPRIRTGHLERYPHSPCPQTSDTTESPVDPPLVRIDTHGGLARFSLLLQQVPGSSWHRGRT